MSAPVVTHGADPDALRAFARASAEGSQQLAETAHRLQGSLDDLAWYGPDQRQFAVDVETRFAPALRSAADALQLASARAAGEAEQQEQVSAAGAGEAVAAGHGFADPDPEREAREAGWTRGAGRLLLGLIGAKVGGPVGGVLGAVAGPALVDHLVSVADERADRTTVTEVEATPDALPTGPADMLHDMADLYDREGTVRVDLVTRPDGSQVALLYVPGTQDWSLSRDGANPMDAYGAVGAASGKDTPLRRLVIEALDSVPPGTPIHAATHSQSSFALLDMAADPYFRARYHLASVVTTGAGGGNFEIPAGTQVVSVRNPLDPFARIGGAREGAIDVTGTWSGDHPHSSREYANLVGRTSSPELEAWWQGVGIDPGSSMRSRVFQGAVAPRD